MQTFVVKLSSGVAALIASVALSLAHIQKDSGDVGGAVAAEALQNANVDVIRIAMTILPIFGLFLALWIFSKRYILTDEKIAEITSKLRESK